MIRRGSKSDLMLTKIAQFGPQTVSGLAPIFGNNRGQAFHRLEALENAGHVVRVEVEGKPRLWALPEQVK